MHRYWRRIIRVFVQEDLQAHYMNFIKLRLIVSTMECVGNSHLKLAPISLQTIHLLYINEEQDLTCFALIQNEKLIIYIIEIHEFSLKYR